MLREMLVHVTRNIDKSKYEESAASGTVIQTRRAFGNAGVTLVRHW